MTVALRWPAKSYDTKAKLSCRLFGHTWHAGWWGDKPYLNQKRGPVDGIGRQHIYLDCRCDKCDTRYTVAMMHGDIGV